MTDVPRPLTPLVGRAREIDELLTLLRHGERRLVTLTGPGGVGKTRLGLEVAGRRRADFDAPPAGRPADGGAVRFVSLADGSDPALVPSTIAQALGVVEGRGASLVEALIAELAEQRLLLVLDGVERVVEAAPVISQLLTGCPTLTVLATSRVRLRVRGEHEYAVAPLAVPTGPALPPLVELERAPSVQLFIERAREARATFQLSASNAEVVVDICRRLDGLPLAIELAAARLRVLSLPELAAGLARQLDVLEGGPRDLPPRQRTMRATIAWSYDLLTPAEQRLARALAVFAGGFNAAAVQAVAADGDGGDGRAGEDGVTCLSVLPSSPTFPSAPSAPSPPSRPSPPHVQPFVVNGLTSMVEKSLIRRLDLGGDLDESPRFDLFESIRAYLLEELERLNDADAARRRHAEYVLAFAERAEGFLLGGGQAVWLDRVEVELANVRAALQWSIAAGERATAMRLGGALWVFWLMRGYLQEGRDHLESLLELPPDDLPSIALVKVLTGAGALAELQGDDETATRLLDEAISRARHLDIGPALATALFFRSLAAFDVGDTDRSESLAAESLGLFRPLGDNWGTALALAALGMAALRRDEHDRAAELLEESRAIFTTFDLTWGVAMATANLGVVAVDRGHFRQGDVLLFDSLTLFRAVGDRWGIATYLESVARGARHQGHPERAARLFGAAEALREAIGARIKPVFAAGHGTNVAKARQGLGNDQFDAAWQEGRAMSVDQAIAYVARPATGTVKGSGSFADLSQREIEVLRLLAVGRTDLQIADVLFISPRTVTTHNQHIFQKLGVKNRTEAVREGTRLGLI